MKKTAPQEQGAEQVSLNELWIRRGVSPSTIAVWMSVEESTVAASLIMYLQHFPCL